MNTTPIKAVFLYSRLSNYFLACLRAVKQTGEAQVMLVHWPGSDDAPFDIDSLAWIDKVVCNDRMSLTALDAEIAAFDPDVIYLAGWVDKAYLKIARKHKSQAVVVAGIDAQWHGTFRQYVARLLAPWYLKNVIDVMWVAGERQRRVAKNFGYASDACWDGLYACDWEEFAGQADRPYRAREKAFLFTGRYAPEKGIDTLAKAYRQYCNTVDKPWKLVSAGAGNFAPKYWDDPRIEHRGFVQPKDLPALMGSCCAFILPSLYEPWGLVVQEAAASGLPMICTESCGAAVHLLQDNYNGYVIDSGSVDQLTQAMIRITRMSELRWEAMSKRSFELSKAFTPERWSDTLLRYTRRHHKYLQKFQIPQGVERAKV